MHYLHAVDYAIIIVYLIFTTVIGMILTRRASTSLDHYFLGNRALPWWLLGIAGMSNWFDLTGTMIITSFLYMLGPRGLYIEFRGGAVLVLAFMLAYHRQVAPPLGRHDRGGMADLPLRPPEVRRSGAGGQGHRTDRGHRRPAGLPGARHEPLPGHHHPLPAQCSMTILLIALTTLYTMCAGFYGVVVTDLIQGVIIIISCLVIAVMAWMMVPDSQHLAATAQAVTGNGQWIDSLPAWHTSMPKGYEAYQAADPGRRASTSCATSSAAWARATRTATSGPATTGLAACSRSSRA